MDKIIRNKQNSDGTEMTFKKQGARYKKTTMLDSLNHQVTSTNINQFQ